MTALMVREVRLALAAGGGAVTAILFYFAVVVALPFAVGPNRELLAAVGPAILWTGALLASLLGLDRLFRPDLEDGSLDQLLIAGPSLAVAIFVKAFAHWLLTGLPLTLIAPVFGLFLSMQGPAIGATVLTLLLGTPAMSFIGAAGAAVTCGLQRGGLLLAVLVLPLCIPSVIFGVGAVRSLLGGIDSFTQPVLFVAGISLFFAVVGPFFAAIALRQAQS